MEYVEVAEAIERPGLRLVLTMGVPGPWGEAAKNILWVKGIDYAPVCQRASTEDPLLLEWTRQTGAPVAMYEKERPRSSWAEILFLAERLAPERPLLPQGPMDRALALGLLHEIAGEQGLGWSRRLMMFARNSVGPADSGSMPWKYGLDDPGATAGAGRRVDAILQLLASRLAEQQAAGRRFFVGRRCPLWISTGLPFRIWWSPCQRNCVPCRTFSGRSTTWRTSPSLHLATPP